MQSSYFQGVVAGGMTDREASTTSAAYMLLLFKLMQSSLLWGVMEGGVTVAVVPTMVAAYQLVLVKILESSYSWGQVARGVTYQVTLRLPLHTFRGPGATPHGQVLLSDRFRQTLLTTSLEVVQAIIYDRVLEPGIYITLAHSITQSMTTIPRMIVLRRQNSPQYDPQDDPTPASGQFSARYAEGSESANPNDPS